MAAAAARDVPTCDRMLAPEFTLTTGRTGNEVRSRAEWLEITGTSYVIDSFEFQWIHVIDLGHVAVARSRYQQRGALGAADRTQSYLMTDVWAQRGRDWQLVTRHVSPLDPGA